MKHRNIKERLPLRREFVYKHRVDLLALDYERKKRFQLYGFTTRLNEREKVLVEKMREEIGYNPATISYDILYSATQLLKRLLKSFDYATRASKEEYSSTAGNSL